MTPMKNIVTASSVLLLLLLLLHRLWEQALLHAFLEMGVERNVFFSTLTSLSLVSLLLILLCVCLVVSRLPSQVVACEKASQI